MDNINNKDYDLIMGNRKKKNELDELFLAEINHKRNQLNKTFETKREMQRMTAHKNGTLDSGVFVSQVIDTELEHATDLSQSLYEIFKRNYCSKGINSKNIKPFFLKLDEFEKNNFSGFCSRLKCEPSILESSQSRFQRIYQRKLKEVIGVLKSTINIELRKGNKAEIENEANKIAQSNSILSFFKWIGLQWKLHNKIKGIVIAILLIIFFIVISFHSELYDIYKNWNQGK